MDPLPILGQAFEIHRQHARREIGPDLFQIEAEFESVFQRGSFFGRVYFHLRPERAS